MPDFVKVIVFSSSAFAFLFLIAKILGKKQIAELDFTDYVVGITIGSIAAEWATELQQEWYHYIIAMSIFAVFSLFISFLEQKATKMKAFLRGKPIIIISEGKFQYKNLKKSKLDIHDILGMCRSQGYFNIQDVEYAILETSGEMSILPKSLKKPVVVEDLKNPDLSESELENYVVLDGKPNIDILNTLNKDVNWLLTRLNLSKKKQLKSIILAIYDEQNDEIIVHYKNE